MKNKTFSRTTVKFACIVLALLIAVSSAHALATYTVSAMAKTSKNAQANAGATNDLTSGSDQVYLPNYDTEVITRTDLAKPTVETFGKHAASYYPSYTNKLTKADFTDDKKQEIFAENQQMLANVKAWFADGTLKTNLKKHVSADGQFSNAAGNYDNAPRIEKIINVNNVSTPRKRSLGVFAPAGEVITVTIDESLVKAGLTVNIGYPYSADDVGSDNFDRWPNDRMAQFYLSFKLTGTVTYVGSPLGGMVTLDGVNTNLGNFSITVSGGIDMPDYKLGVSTVEDWQNILAAPSPYVWLLTPHQYFVMPKVEISDVDDPYDAMLWWHKASMISMYSIAREDTAHFTTPVISVFDSYVFIGEAVATVWAFYTNCPSYWCKGVLSYDNLMYGGAWGALHEYNHHHQAHAYSTQWGVGGVDEMTNNVLNAISYIYLTDVALTRSDSKMLNGWAVVSDPYSNYARLASASSSANNYEGLGTSKLFGFVDMMHKYGADKFAAYVRAQFGYGEVEGYEGTNLSQDTALQNADDFALFTCLFYKTDFTDYFTKVWHMEISDKVVQQIAKYKFDKYFSISNLYSAGVKGVETGRAYKVSPNETTVLKLNEYTACSVDDYKLTKVSKPKNGKLVNNGDGTYSYTPNKGFTNDSFELTYKVTVDKKSYKTTLVVNLTNADNADAERTASSKALPAYVDFRNIYLDRWYSNYLTYTPSEVACLDNNGNAVKTVNGANINNLVDGNTSTGFHTAWQGSMTPYPHNYYFTFDDEVSFNQINFTFGDNGYKGYYAIGEYEIYTSGDGQNYKLVSAGNNTETRFNAVIGETVTTKYVKLVVKSNASGNAFTNITEVQFAQGIALSDDYNVYASSESLFNYAKPSAWTDVVGNYLNGKAKHTDKGKVSFYLTGTNLMLYSTNAESKITIDGKSYTIKANDKKYSPSFIIEGLRNRRHLVVIEGNDMNFDMIKISSDASGKANAVNWAGMGVAIALGAALIGTLTAFIVLEVKRKKTAEKA